MNLKSPKTEPPAWSHGGVWICTKCFQNSNTAENLKNQFKTRLKEQGLGKSVRVMTSSCLGICPEGSQAALIVEKGCEPKALVFHPERDSEAVFVEIQKMLVED